MIALLQRVVRAQVEIADITAADIGPGILALVGFDADDAPQKTARMAERILGYRLFSDADGKMNRSLADTEGALLLVPQFTLAADTNRGMRASFSCAAAPEAGRELFTQLVAACRQRHDRVEIGQFGADMQVELVNDGPVTFILRV